MIILNKKGQSIIQTLVGLALTAIVSLIITTVVSNVQSLVGDTDRILKIEELHSEIMLILSDPKQCSNTFYRYSIPAAGGSVVIPGASGIRIKDDSVKYRTNSTIGQRQMRIESMTMKNFTNAPTSGVSAPYTGSFTLEIQYSYKPSPAVLARNQWRQIRIKTLPANWAPGTRMVDATKPAGCSSGLGATTGLDLGPFITRANRNNTKYNIFRVNGNVEVMTNIFGRNSGSLTMLSDERLKSNFIPLKFNSNQIQSVEGYSFKWKDTQKLDYGFMADELESLDPDLVFHQKGGPDLVKYQEMVPILHQSLIDMGSETNDLKRRVAKLNKKAR